MAESAHGNSITIINSFNGSVLIIILTHMHLFVDIISRSYDNNIWTPSIVTFSQLLVNQKKEWCMRSNTWLRGGSGEECVTANIMPPRSKTKKMLPPKKSAKKTLPPNQSAKAPRKDPQRETRTLWLRRKGIAQTTRFSLIQNEWRKQVIPKYALWQWPTFQTSLLQLPTPTGARNQPK